MRNIYIKVYHNNFILREYIKINIKDIDKQNDLIVFDSSSEGGSHFAQSRINNFLSFYKEKYKLKKAIFLTMNEKASSKKHGIFYKNFAWDLYCEGGYQRINFKESTQIFTYLGGSARPEKCKVLNKLFERGLLEDAIWSFSGENHHGKRKYFHPDIMRLLPRSSDLCFNNKKTSKYRKSWAEINTTLYYSRFSLVQETEMSNISNRYTEKTFKCLVIGHPFVVAGNYQVLKLLRKDGFKTFSPYIDESYDDVEDTDERIALIIKETDRLCKMSESEWSELLINIEPILEHNHQRSKTIKNKKDLWKNTWQD